MKTKTLVLEEPVTCIKTNDKHLVIGCTEGTILGNMATKCSWKAHLLTITSMVFSLDRNIQK